MTLRIDCIENGFWWLVANLSLWLFVVFLYTQSIGLWNLLVVMVGKSLAGGIPLTLAALLIVLVVVWGRRYCKNTFWSWGAASATVFVFGLWAIDPAFPAKRVHIPEYFLLTMLVHWSCRHQLPRLLAIWGAVALSIALGSIDEILQGAMLTRTFGMRDVVTNSLGAFSAGLCLQSMPKCATPAGFGGSAFACALLLFGLGLLLIAANAYKGAELPVWAYLPALAALPLITLNRAVPGARLVDALGTLCVIALLLMGGIDALDLDFQ